MAVQLVERERTKEEENSRLKAYGRLSGGVAPEEKTEEQRAMEFNARIAENYRKLVDPDYNRTARQQAETPVYAEPAQPMYGAPQNAMGASAPVQDQAVYTVDRGEVSDLFRAGRGINTKTVPFAQAQAAQEMYAQPETYAPQEAAPQYGEAAGYAQPAMTAQTVTEEELAPTATTTQYKYDLYKDEQKKEEGISLTSKGKLMIAIYAIVAVVILALIIVNTAVLGSLEETVSAKEAELAEAIQISEELEEEISYYTSEETIISRAETELGMILGNN